jgi:hypothetical protein
MRRIVLELKHEGRWRIFSDLHEGGALGSLMLDRATSTAITFGFDGGRPVVLETLSLADSPQIRVGAVPAWKPPLAYLDEGPYETVVHRESAVPLRLRLEEAS